MTRHSRGRRKKRYWLLGALAVSLLLWWTSLALLSTGHTKLLWAGEKLAKKAHHAPTLSAPKSNDAPSLR